MHPEVKEAFNIALRDLHNCFAEHGILAGRGKMNYYKARNSFFASLGANSMGEFTASWKSLDLFFAKQRRDGLIPHRIEYKLKPHFHHIVSEPLDGNALAVIALKDYYDKSRDRKFVQKHFENARKAITWLKRRDFDRDLLLEEPFFAGWQETVLKSGKVLYSNCLYYKALKDFAELAELMKLDKVAEEHSRLAERVKQQINSKFWQGNYYADWIDLTRHDNFCADGNVLSILFGIADKEQGQMIQNKIKQHQLSKVPLQANYPAYPFWRIPPGLFPLDAYHYHNTSSWLWLGSLNAIAMKKIGLKKEPKQELKRIAQVINGNGSVHEVFFEGKPINSLLLKSEPFYAWSAGLFVKAVNEVSGKQND